MPLFILVQVSAIVAGGASSPIKCIDFKCLLNHDDTIGMFVFADGLTVNFDRFKDALEGNLKPSAG